MNPRTYRNHAWAQLAQSDTFYIRGSPEERRLHTALGLDADGDAEFEDDASDLEAQGMNTLSCRRCTTVHVECWDVFCGCVTWRLATDIDREIQHPWPACNCSLTCTWYALTTC